MSFVIHFIYPSQAGRVLSNPDARYTFNDQAVPSNQLQVACNPAIGLPVKDEHGLCPDSRNVTCPLCQQTEPFLTDFKLQTKTDFNQPTSEPSEG